MITSCAPVAWGYGCTIAVCQLMMQFYRTLFVSSNQTTRWPWSCAQLRVSTSCLFCGRRDARPFSFFDQHNGIINLIKIVRNIFGSRITFRMASNDLWLRTTLYIHNHGFVCIHTNVCNVSPKTASTFKLINANEGAFQPMVITCFIPDAGSWCVITK